MNRYGFQERLVMSHGAAQGAQIEHLILGSIPGALSVHPAHPINDRHGTDFWVEHASGRHLSVDCKIRSADWLPRGCDDLAIETWSVVETGKIGWSRDPNKRTDFVLWFWADTGRWCLMPFPMLCGVCQEHWERWRGQYRVACQKTQGNDGSTWTSECVFVLRRTVWSEVYRRYGGEPLVVAPAGDSPARPVPSSSTPRLVAGIGSDAPISAF
jgi:hypothetical protein